MNRDTEILRDVAQNVAAELTRTALHPAQGHNVFAPHLVKLGERLQEALNQADGIGLRPDVAHFAGFMSRMMDAKECEQKRPVSSLNEALMNIQGQMRRFEDAMPLNEQERARILVHIANWCMLGFRLLDRNISAIF